MNVTEWSVNVDFTTRNPTIMARTPLEGTQGDYILVMKLVNRHLLTDLPALRALLPLVIQDMVDQTNDIRISRYVTEV